ncbi:Mov34/MPN/PAD-1 family protein [Synergistales bacterium]|nr:Mov34/MPN/PAD-1 family protein [Synergistales bacterium]
MISIPPEVTRLIESEGARAYPNECCGILLGEAGESEDRAVTEALPAHNGFEAEERYHRFVIEPEDLRQAEKTAGERGLDVIGFYHSHPDHPAIPSGYDLEHAVPWYSYVIVAIAKGVPGDMTSWRLAPDRSKFIREL